MKGIKAILGLSILAAALVGCSDDMNADKQNNSEEVKLKTEEIKTDEPTQDELNEQLKLDAVESDYTIVDGNGVKEGTKLYTEGVVSFIVDSEVIPEFILTSSTGIYKVKNFLSADVQDGDKVKVYGVYGGKDGSSFPILNVTIVEPIEQ